jgi:hypothetical protein
MRFQTTVLALVLVGPIALHAQDRTDFTRLQSLLKPSDKVTVTTTDGTKLTGKMQQVSTDEIVLRTKSGDQAIMSDRVAKVRQQHNGFLLGALIGAGAAIPFVLILDEYSYNEGGPGGAVALVPVGAFAGMGIDGLIPSMKTVYDRKAKRHVAVNPFANRRQVGARLSFKF